MFRGQLIRKGSSERTEVFISIGQGSIKLSNGEVFTIDSVSVGERSGVNSPFFVYLPNGDQLIITENVKEFGKEFYRHLPVHRRDWLHRFETWGKSLVVSVIVLIIATVFWLTKGSDMAAEWLSEKISYDLEYELGTHIVSGLERLGWQIREPRGYKEEQLEEMFYDLAKESGIKNARLYIYENSYFINAYAIPGGYVFFTSGLIEDYISEAEGMEALAGVAAHELGHIKHRHSLKILIKSALISSIFTILTGDVSIVSLAMAQQLLTLAYTRKQEEEADVFAIKLLFRSYISPEPFLGLMEDFKKQEGMVEIPEFLSTHPHISDRIKKMRQLIDELDREGKRDIPL